MTTFDDEGRGYVPEGPDPEATVLMPDGGAADPEATVLQDPQADPDATVLSDEVPARPAHFSATLPSFDSGPFAEPESEPAPDAGFDDLDGPYFGPDESLDFDSYDQVVPTDLTTAYAPVAIESPVQSLPGRRRRHVWLIVLVVLALCAAGAYAAYYTYEEEYWGGKTIPTVVGLTEEEAVEALESLGFEVEVSYALRDTNLGIVLTCSPSAGTRTDTSETVVSLTVSTSRIVPEVVGLDVSSATEALTEVGATSISLTYENSDEEAGTVLSVSPAEGEAFVSSDTITLVVAQVYTVPNVVGMTADEATETLEAAGLAVEVSYVDSDEAHYTVVSASPGVGEQVEGGATVTLSVSSPFPDDAFDLVAYFDPEPEDLSDFLAEQGFTIKYGSIYVTSGNAREVLTNSNGDVVQITDTPEDGSYSGSNSGDVLADGATVGGVRYVFTAASLPEGATVESESGIQAVMELCGLSGLLGTCTQDDLIDAGFIEVEEVVVEVEADETSSDDADATADEDGSDAEGDADASEDEGDSEDGSATTTTTTTITTCDYSFICAYGKQGDYTWAILIGGKTGSTKVVAIVAPTSHFDSIDLSAYGGTVATYVACVDLLGM